MPVETEEMTMPVMVEVEVEVEVTVRVLGDTELDGLVVEERAELELASEDS